jgi:hypothetical protein
LYPLLDLEHCNADLIFGLTGLEGLDASLQPGDSCAAVVQLVRAHPSGICSCFKLEILECRTSCTNRETDGLDALTWQGATAVRQLFPLVSTSQPCCSWCWLGTDGSTLRSQVDLGSVIPKQRRDGGTSCSVGLGTSNRVLRV